MSDKVTLSSFELSQLLKNREDSVWRQALGTLNEQQLDAVLADMEAKISAARAGAGASSLAHTSGIAETPRSSFAETIEGGLPSSSEVESSVDDGAHSTPLVGDGVAGSSSDEDHLDVEEMYNMKDAF